MDEGGHEEPGRRLQEAGTKRQAGMPCFLHVNRCPRIIPVWYSSLTPAFLWAAPGKDLVYPGRPWPTCCPFPALPHQTLVRLFWGQACLAMGMQTSSPRTGQRQQPGYTTQNPSSVKHCKQQKLWMGSGAI